jgi:hypothetical protein
MKEYWNRVGQKLVSLESLYSNFSPNNGISNIYQGIPSYPDELDKLLKNRLDLYLPDDYYLMKRPWKNVSFPVFVRIIYRQING